MNGGHKWCENKNSEGVDEPNIKVPLWRHWVEGVEKLKSGYLGMKLRYELGG